MALALHGRCPCMSHLWVSLVCSGCRCCHARGLTCTHLELGVGLHLSCQPCILGVQQRVQRGPDSCHCHTTNQSTGSL